ncbi:MAG: hypothetical protein RIC24_07775 [Hyphomicrobiales bacterium]
MQKRTGTKMRWLFEQLFTGWLQGRLKRLPFALLSAGLVAVALLAQQGLIIVLTSPPDLIPGAPAPSRLDWIIQNPLVVTYWIIGLITAAALFLTTIKRVRDMGLPVLLALAFMVALLLTEQVNGIVGTVADVLNFLVLAGLLFIPSDWFRRAKAD